MEFAVLLVVGAILCHCVNAGDEAEDGFGGCKDAFKEMKISMNGMIDEGTDPQCSKDINLKQFRCTSGDDEEKDKQIGEKLKEWFNGLDEEAQNEAEECITDFVRTSMEAAGEKVSQECKVKWEDFSKMMLRSRES